jgi:hypothetical protein
MQVARTLRGKCGLDETVSSVDLGETFQFDAVLVGSDPLELVVVEGRRQMTESELKSIVHKLESFVWSLHALNKHHMVSAVIALDKLPGPPQTEKLLRRLTGVCRVFLVSGEGSEIARYVGSAGIAPPDAPQFDVAGLLGQVASLPSALRTAHATELIQVARGCKSPDEVGRKLSERFAELTKGVEDALTESPR